MKIADYLKPVSCCLTLSFSTSPVNSGLLTPNLKRRLAFSSFRMMLLLFIVHSSFIIPNCFSQWSQISTINTAELRGVKFFNQFTGIALGVGGIWRSTNSGVNWTQVLSSVNMNGLSFYDNSNGYAVGDSGKIFRTFDNGLIWQQQGNGVTNNKLYGVCFSTSLMCHAVGVSGIILRTLNSGTTWTTQTLLGGSEEFLSIVMNNNGEGIVVGSLTNERGYNTGNGGTNWIGIPNLINGYGCFDISFISNFPNIIITGSNGRIRKSTNAGYNWTFPQSNVSVNLNSVTFVNANEGYIAGNNGAILKTTDGGLNWLLQPTGVSNNLKDISAFNATIAWAVGANGIVLRTGIPISIQTINSQTPKVFKLHQNYPNPFNPTTKIRFDINKNSARTELSIYDILGNKIQTLVNESLKPGTYEINWDAASYASGVYFVVLESASTKIYISMIVLK